MTIMGILALFSSHLAIFQKYTYHCIYEIRMVDLPGLYNNTEKVLVVLSSWLDVIGFTWIL